MVADSEDAGEMPSNETRMNRPLTPLVMHARGWRTTQPGDSRFRLGKARREEITKNVADELSANEEREVSVMSSEERMAGASAANIAKAKPPSCRAAKALRFLPLQ